MLATTLSIEFNAEMAWHEREQVYIASRYIFGSFHICQTAKGDKDGKWTTVVTAMIFVTTD